MKTVIKTFAEFVVWLKINWKDLMAIDFETTSLGYLEMELVGFSLYNGENACYVDMLGIGQFDLSSFFSKNQVLIMHHAPFDMACLKKFFNITDGFKPICTLIGAKLIDENRVGREPYTLKTLAVDWLKIPADQVMKWEKAKDFGYQSQEWYDYGTNDAIWTWDLWQYEKSELEEEKLDYLFNDVEMPFQFVLRDLETNGVLIDQMKLHNFKQTVRLKLIEIEAEMLKVFGMQHYCQTMLFGEGNELISPINFDSTRQLVDLIEFKLGFNVDTYTRPTSRFPEGQKSVAREYVVKMLGKHPFFELLYRRGKLQTLLTTFIEPCPNFISKDGKIRPDYHLVRSGRLSCSKPNLTNLPNPKREKLEVNYREIFIPEKGNVFVKADFSGQELRNLAEVSGDKRMKDIFKRNLDMHLISANDEGIFNLGLSESDMTIGGETYKDVCVKFEKERYLAKNGVNFPIVYGSKEYGISRRLNVSVWEARRWIKRFYKLYPDVQKAITQTKIELEKQGYVTTLLGRKRRFFDYSGLSKREQAAALRQAFNHKIQGLSADQAKIAASKVMSILKEFGAELKLWVHDEVVWSLPEAMAEAFAKRVKTIMESSLALSVSAEVDVSIVRSFGE